MIMNPELNIGIVGHVDHGKTTLVEALTGQWVDTFSEEKKRGITIRLGYADFSVSKCKKCGKICVNKKCMYCFSDCEPVKTFSLVDAPGHESLIPVVLTGASIFNAAILVIAANEKCPQPQTKEHLKALDIGEIKNIIIVQNKVDLVTRQDAERNYQEIRNFLKGTVAENSPILPMSAQQGVGIEYLLEELLKITASECQKGDFLFLIARSFDTNKPGTLPENLSGAVVGGSVIRGSLKRGEEVTIRPVSIDGKYIDLKTKIRKIRRGDSEVEEATCGGLVALETSLDPSMAKSDKLVGCIVGAKNLPEAVYELETDYHVFDTHEIKTNDILLATCRNSRSTGTVVSINDKKIKLNLKLPICVDSETKISFSKLVGGKWQLVGWGKQVK